MSGSNGTSRQLRRPSWNEVWAHVAEAVSARSLCIRAQIGAVIVDSRHRIVATGYNGPPASFPHGNLTCDKWCERAVKSGFTGSPDLLRSDYSDCPSLHAEANALLAADRSTWQGGIIYVLGDVCFNCAKLIANSGLSEVVVRRYETAEHRQPAATYAFLAQCGLTVVIDE